MSETPKTYSLALRVRRITYEDAYVAVAVTDDILRKQDDGTFGIDFEAFVAEAIRISHHPDVEWQIEASQIEPHPTQGPKPEDRLSFDSFSVKVEPQAAPDIRRASAGDAATIATITNAAYAKYVPLMGRNPQPMDADYQQILAEHPVWLLYVDQQPAGLIVLMHEPEALLIYSVAVHPQYQRLGLGRQLLGWAEEQARQAGYATIRLYTNALMVENIALYGRLGYTETRREPFGALMIVHMAKQL
jgi:ribosomal protein S18 acetylase RimI-like enzyme